MIAADKITGPHAEALLKATPPEQRTDTAPSKPDIPQGDPLEKIVKLEKEMSQVQTKYKDAEANYGSDLLNLVVARGYLSKLISTPTVKDYLTQNHPDILDTFELVVNTVSMDEAVSGEGQDPGTSSDSVHSEDDDSSDEPSNDQ
jgi:hypothetical protein